MNACKKSAQEHRCDGAVRPSCHAAVPCARLSKTRPRRGLGRAAYADAHEHEIRTNAVAPSVIRTDMSKGLWSHPERLAAHDARNPASRIGEPNEVAAVVGFLAWPAASFMKGQTIAVDGGHTIAYD